MATAERLIDDSLRYAMERQQFGKPIAEFQLIQAMLAEVEPKRSCALYGGGDGTSAG
ncbi:MAG: hypothetical protein Ct9H300mP13_2670 [Gammaproteobacteria bacterium]|nr:MAG: hypothetical protein Ct9H300mP13_2670 [Gammaproteobacteria bacterium]